MSHEVRIRAPHESLEGGGGMLAAMVLDLVTRAQPRRAAAQIACLMGLWGLGCKADPGGTGSFISHCSELVGDATCRANYENRPFCSTCVVAEDNQGCVASRPPPACRASGGSASGTGDGGTSGTDTGEVLDADSSSTSGFDTTTSTTGPLACSSAEGSFDEACEEDDPTRPYCVGSQCSSCVEAGDHDFCADKDATTPACDDVSGLCLPCGEAAASVCTGATPVCDPGGGCVECITHDDCPGTACHLHPSDPMVGACFGSDEVIWVDAGHPCPGMGTKASPACSLAQVVATTPAGGRRVIFVDGGFTTYPEQIVVDDGVTLAIIGTAGPLISGNPNINGPSFVVTDDARLYVRGLRLANNGGSHGLSCGNATIVMEDTHVRANNRYGVYTTAPCDLTMRRSAIYSNGHGGVRQFGGNLHVVNSSIGINGNGSNGPAINAQYANVEVLYSTIAGNSAVGADNVWCLQSDGWVRNSIVVGAQAGSIALSCFSIEFTHNAVDSASFGGGTNKDVGAYSATWFVNPHIGNYQLTAAGQSVLAGIAQWKDGDPPLDADGTPRPMGPGFPGMDEP